jgi:hypothetical protein
MQNKKEMPVKTIEFGAQITCLWPNEALKNNIPNKPPSAASVRGGRRPPGPFRRRPNAQSAAVFVETTRVYKSTQLRSKESPAKIVLWALLLLVRAVRCGQKQENN